MMRFYRFCSIKWLLRCAVLWCSLITQVGLTQTIVDVAELSIAQLSDEVSRELESLRAFEAINLPDSFERRRILEIRRDEKTINLLSNILALADRVLALPADAPERESLRQLVEARESVIEEALVDRFSSLTLRLNESITRQSALTGAERLREESFSVLFDGQRLLYLELSTEQVLLLRRLQLDDTLLREKAVRTLTYFGEEMMGQIHLHHHGLKLLAARQASDGTDADLLQAARYETERLKVALKRLRGVVSQLDRLDADTLEMRRVLIEESGSVSLSLVDTAMVNILYAEVTNAIEDWLSNQGLSTLVSVVLFILILIAARQLARVTRRLTERALAHSDQAISQLLRETLISMAGTVVFLIGLLVALAQVGVSVAPMIAGLGVVGFIVGFALQDTLSNFASGAMILAYRPFDTGDFIAAGDAEGTVLKMNLVNTTIVTIENKVLIIPNSKIWGGVIMNVTGQKQRRTDIIYRVSYSDDIDLVQRILEELIDADERWLDDPEPLVRLKQYSESSIDFMVRAYANTDDFWEAVWALNKAVKKRFDAEGITIPFPQRDVHLPRDTDQVSQIG